MLQYFKINNQEIQEVSEKPKPPRQRDYHEIMWIQEGAAKFIVDGDLYHIEANSVFVFPKGRVHQFMPNKKVEGHVIRFTEDFLDNFPRLLFSKFHTISHVKISDKENDIVEHLFKAFQLEYLNHSKNSLVIIHLLKTIIEKINHIKQLQLPKNSILCQNLDIFDQFQILLDENILKEQSPKFYAEKLNLTPRKLNEILKQFLNKSTMTSISERLLIEAKREILYTDKNISNIAYSLGFEDNSYFTKFFKKHTNTTPKEYRKQNAFSVSD
ncbi:helix-turn-helix domain-containing protein [Aureivirga sp. CE67]|uniref:helix-turn-helix domain-containing protein n=1 Tax=Aureivirga sp. CE67 TaxID=1788983 RepID=UPI0018C92A29|nr:helix-turn-helix transcriptional regulator [Aureivirga sp. CE67]